MLWLKEKTPWSDRLLALFHSTFCISKARFGSFSLIWEHRVGWPPAFFLSCNHCNIISFRAKSHPVLDACLVPPDRNPAPNWESAADPPSRSTVHCKNIPCVSESPTPAKRVRNFYAACSHPSLCCTPPTPHARERPSKLRNKFHNHVSFFSLSVYLLQVFGVRGGLSVIWIPVTLRPKIPSAGMRTQMCWDELSEPRCLFCFNSLQNKTKKEQKYEQNVVILLQSFNLTRSHKKDYYFMTFFGRIIS